MPRFWALGMALRKCIDKCPFINVLPTVHLPGPHHQPWHNKLKVLKYNFTFHNLIGETRRLRDFRMVFIFVYGSKN